MEKEAKQCLQTEQWIKGAELFSQLLLLKSLDTSQRITYLLNRSECYLQMKEFKSAILDSMLIIDLIEDNKVMSDTCNTARSNLVQALFLSKEYRQAEFVLREWLALLNKSAEAPKLLERLHLAMHGSQNNTLLRNELSTFITHHNNTNQSHTQSCVYCNVEFYNKNELREHCQTEEHQQVVMSDDGRDWYWRAPPRGFDMQSDALCKYWAEKGSCRFGNSCMQAHGSQELDEWNARIKYRQMRLQRAYEQKLLGESYTLQLLEKLKRSPEPQTLLKDDIEHIQVTCCSRLTTTVVSKSTSKKWTFTLTSSKAIRVVALLHDTHRAYFEIDEIISEIQHDTVFYDVANKQEWLCDIFPDNINTDIKYFITIKFCTDVYGTFRQSVIFDFGAEDVLCKNLCVDVIPAEQVQKIEKIKQEIALISKERWTDANFEIIPFTTLDVCYNENYVSENYWKNLYPCPIRNNVIPTSDIFDSKLSKNNYRLRMHTLLFMEEMARNEHINKFNVKAKLHVVNNYMLDTPIQNSVTKYSSFGELYAYINLNHDISEDSSWGRLLLNSCLSVLLSVQDPKVYEAVIEDKGKNIMYLRLSATTVKDLELKPNCSFTAQLQFQLNRLPFCEWHYAVDKLPDLKVIFPEKFVEPLIPWSPDKQWSNKIDPRLNIKQKEALIAITTPTRICLPPVLLIGPFGTGKTFTFAQAVKEVLKQEDTRILICTHSNSAADIYIKDYFHEYYEAGHLDALPLRIYYQKRWVYSVHPIVQRYCLIKVANKTRMFQPPTIEDIVKHRIIVVTLSTSLYLCNLGLPRGFFTHILLDEAAQTIECEAIMPLFLATPYTRIVLAGDHMQLSPEMHSSFAKECNLHVSLLERLYDHYPAVFPCKILLCENYRAHEAIIDFTSEMFYEQKLVASGKQLKHPNMYPLTFFTVRGEDVQDINSTAFYNNSEAYEIVERVSELKKSWPKAWGNFNEQSIGILACYSDQVVRIRYELRKRCLGKISVERVLNVQGKQFRAIFLSIVRTGKTCTNDTKEKSDYGFLSDSKLLNTAITRAQSLVVVVGDPIALCTIGRCSKIWERFLSICGQNNSLNGITWSNLKYQLDGLELKKIYGLNPLAPEFVPQSQKKHGYMFVEVPKLHYAPPSVYQCPSTAMTVYVGLPPPVPAPIARPCPQQGAPITYLMSAPTRSSSECDLIQFLDKVHIPEDLNENGHSLHDLMNLLPKNMSLANVLVQPPQFHLQWYQHLLVKKGLEAANSFEYLISVVTNKPKSGVDLPRLAQADSEDVLLPVNLPYLDQQMPNLYQYNNPANQINFDKPVYHLPNVRGHEHGDSGEINSVYEFRQREGELNSVHEFDESETQRLYQRQSVLNDAEKSLRF